MSTAPRQENPPQPELDSESLTALQVNDRVAQTIDYFKNNQIDQIYPCHCTAFAVKATIHSRIPIVEVGVGLELVW